MKALADPSPAILDSDVWAVTVRLPTSNFTVWEYFPPDLAQMAIKVSFVNAIKSRVEGRTTVISSELYSPNRREEVFSETQKANRTKKSRGFYAPTPSIYSSSFAF